MEELEDQLIVKHITEDQWQIIKNLDDYILSISSTINMHYWNNDALSQSTQWKIIRELADEILVIMQWDKNMPSKCDAIFVAHNKRLSL